MWNRPGTVKTITWGQIWELAKSATAQGRFSRSVIGSYALQIGSVLLSLVASIMLARLLGPSGFGDYAYALNWVLVLSTLATLGMDKLAVRSVASYSSKGQWSLVKGLVGWATIRVLLFSILVIAVSLLIRRFIIVEQILSTSTTLVVALLLIPLLTLTRVHQGVLRGLHHIVQGLMSETIIRPLLLIFLLVFGYLSAGQMTAPLAMGLHVVATAVSLGIVLLLVIYVLRPETSNLQPANAGRLWWIIATPLLFSGMLAVINQRASTLMLGSLLNTEAVGIYNVAKRLVEPIVFVLIAVELVLAPRVASYYASNQFDEMQSMVTRSARIILLVSLPIALLIVLLGPWLLLLWGPEFRQGYSVVVILILGQLVSASVGPVVLLLNMTKHERDVVVGLAISSTLLIVLNYVLIPLYGVNGAAIATVMGSLTWNVLLAYQVRKVLRIDSTVVGKPLSIKDNGQ